jgi:hypothetical protein
VIDPNNKLIYRERKYKYQVLNPDGFTIDIGIKGYYAESKFFTIRPDGRWTANFLYAWDGASGPTHDDEENMVPALFHDIGYQAIRMGLIPLSVKKELDDMLMRLMIERGASHLRAKIYHDGVTIGGGSSCVPGTDNDEIKEVV